MIVVVVALGVVCVALLVWIVVLARQSGARSARIVELDGKLVEADLAAASASERADKESARAVEAEGRAKASESSATAAERRADDAERRSEEAEEKVAEAIDRADRSEERALAASESAAVVEAELAAALEIRLFDADGMWAFGRRRMERLWRDRLRLFPDDEPPLDGSSADTEAAVRLMAEASREESGVVVDVVWSVTDDLSPARTALLVLLAEELIAIARESDGGELDVRTDGDAIMVTLRADPGTGAATVTELRRAVESFGWTLTADDREVAVRVPAPSPAPAGPSEEPAR